jgi:cation diffusion facilitator family transporter
VAADSTSHILQSLVVNAVIAGSKGVAAVYTGSGAMLAETIHSAADCGNQLLLLLGVKRSRAPATETHPLGHGRALYFWSFMVALLLFTGGGVFSIYEGVHKIRHPEPVENIFLAFAILLFSLGLEGYATYSNVKEANRRRGTMSFFRYIRETKDSDFVVVMGENSAASLGLGLALVSLLLAHLTHDSRWDAIGSLAIGVVLVCVAIFLAREVQSLLIGERADPTTEAAVRSVLAQFPELGPLLRLITVQQGPGQVIVAMKIRPAPDLPARALSEAINRFEDELARARPEVQWSFVEPDLSDE